jgi:hypothetical protein
LLKDATIIKEALKLNRKENLFDLSIFFSPENRMGWKIIYFDFNFNRLNILCRFCNFHSVAIIEHSFGDDLGMFYLLETLFPLKRLRYILQQLN